MPLLEIIKSHKQVLCSAIFISSIPVSMFYLASVYIPNFYFDQSQSGLALSSLSLTCIVQILCMIFIPLFALAADKFGKESQLKLTSLLLIFTPILAFFYMAHLSSLTAPLVGITLFSCFAGLYSGPAPAYLSEKFPVIGRYSGLGLSISIGEGLFGGLTPVICVTLQEFFDSKIAPAFFIMLLGLLSFTGILFSNKKISPLSKKNGQKYLNSEDAIQKT